MIFKHWLEENIFTLTIKKMFGHSWCKIKDENHFMWGVILKLRLQIFDLFWIVCSVYTNTKSRKAMAIRAQKLEKKQKTLVIQ